MDERWLRITEIFNAALEREPAERAGYLDQSCGDDPGLRAEVDSLLAAHQKADDFLERPAGVARGLVPAAVPWEDLAPGRIFGPYRVEREIGRGGMGVVYEAEDTRLGRQVAIKVLTPAVASDATMRERLRLEARAAAGLSHPAVATVFSFEEIDGRACLITEFVRGDTLRSEVARGPLELAAVIETGIQVARGPRGGARRGHRPPRPEARQRRAGSPGPGQDPRLRDRALRHAARRRSRPASRTRARLSARPATCPRSSSTGPTSISGATSSRSASSSSSSRRASTRSRGPRQARRWPG